MGPGIVPWKSKHMVAMAQFQTKSGIFAGVLLPYKMPKLSLRKKKHKNKKLVKTAILGGGDIGFPLIFSGVIMKTYGFYYSLFKFLCILLQAAAVVPSKCSWHTTY